MKGNKLILTMRKIGFFGGTGFVGTAFYNFVTSKSLPFQLFRISRNASLLGMDDCLDCDANNQDTFLDLPDFDIVIHGVVDSTIGHQIAGYAKLKIDHNNN